MVPDLLRKWQNALADEAVLWLVDVFACVPKEAIVPGPEIVAIIVSMNIRHLGTVTTVFTCVALAK
jgi:hypothetical protein